MSLSAPIYVYGVVAEGEDLPDAEGIDGEPVRLVDRNGVGAVVSDLRESTPRLGREAMTTHERVLESILSRRTVLPMRFGVVMEDDAAVRDRLLAPYHDDLCGQLARFDGRVELTLRGIYEEEPLMRQIIAEDIGVRRLYEALRGTDPDATYFERIRLGEMIAAAVESRRQRDADEILATLQPLAEDVRLAEPTHERMVLNASFLVARDRVPAFDEAVDDVGRRNMDMIRLRYTGPLPPHTFVALEEAS